MNRSSPGSISLRPPHITQPIRPTGGRASAQDAGLGLLRKQVLYVEDGPTNVLLMRALFEHRPHLRLVVATDGAEAMGIAPFMHPALLLLDLNLPDCHGSELLLMLRRMTGLHPVTAIAVTAETDFSLRGTGFLELWPKPLDMAWALERLDALVPKDRP
jgi:CheY-like chemotaxis protein